MKAIIKADFLTATREVAKELNVDNSMVIRHLKQIGKVKNLDKWVPRELTTNLKEVIIIILKVSNKLSSLILHDNNEPFLDQIVTCNEKWILYNNLQ